MEQILTLTCKLNATPEQVAKLDATAQAFADACNYANQTVRAGITSKATIQSEVYADLRARFGLNANLAVRACARVGMNRKAAKTKKKPVKEFKASSIDYDARIFSFRESDWTVSLSTTDGRERIVMEAANYQRGKLTGQSPTSAQLCKHKDGLYYLHVQVKKTPPEPKPYKRFIGVDMGRRKIAVTSDGQEWSGKGISQVRDKYAKQRASLQRKATKGTRSTRRRSREVSKRLSGRERRFQAWWNHTVSYRIVKRAVETSAVIVLEDLTGIRERTNKQPRNKTERRRSNSWANYQLRSFIEYKSVRDGAYCMVVRPHYSSQTHHVCLHIGDRRGERFFCPNCQVTEDADHNASKVISLIGAAVAQPRGPWLSCEIVAGLPKASSL